MCYTVSVNWAQDLSVPQQVMCPRRVVLQILPESSVPRRLPLYNSRHPLTPSESTLLQVLIPLHFISSRINTYTKQGGGSPLHRPKVLQLVTTPKSLLRAHTNVRNSSPLYALLHSSLYTHNFYLPCTFGGRPALKSCTRLFAVQRAKGFRDSRVGTDQAFGQDSD